MDENYDAFLASNPDFQVSSKTPIEENGKLVAYSFDSEFTVGNDDWKGLGRISTQGRWTWLRWGVTRESAYELNAPLLEATLGSFTHPVVATKA